MLSCSFTDLFVEASWYWNKEEVEAAFADELAVVTIAAKGKQASSASSFLFLL